MEAEAGNKGPLHDQLRVNDAQGLHRRGRELVAAIHKQSKGRQQKERQDGDQGEEVDVV